MADAGSAASSMRQYVTPVIQSLCVIASLVCAFFLTTGGFHYMTSSGSPESLDNAKRTLRNALVGLVVVLGAAALTTILTHAYSGSSTALNAKLPSLNPITPAHTSNGLVDIIIKAVTGLLNNIIQSIGAPFLKALTFFTTSTPLMTANSVVFNLWLVVVGMTDVIFTVVVALLGFHIMGASTFGFDEIEFKHLLPRLALIFMLVNCSIFAIDGVIEFSNAMIHAINAASGASSSVWDVLTKTIQQTSGEGVAALLIMVAFLIFAVILLVYYVGRLVTLYIGAVLSPLLLVLWLVPGFRDFSETAAKIYLTTIFVLFVHVVILLLAASLLTGVGSVSPSGTPDTLMAMIVGLATLIALLKTQGVMAQFSYASLGPRNARKLGGLFVNSVSVMSNKGKKVMGSRSGGSDDEDSDTDNNSNSGNQGFGKNRRPAYAMAGASYNQPPASSSRSPDPYEASFDAESLGMRTEPKVKPKTGETTVAPKAFKPPKSASHKSNNHKDKDES
jgi:hypothetical protein